MRFGRITPPKNPNQLPVDFRLFKYYGDQIELEHKHNGFTGRKARFAYLVTEITRTSDASPTP